MDNKRLFLAALLSVGVLLLWQTIFPAAPPPSDSQRSEPTGFESEALDRDPPEGTPGDSSPAPAEIVRQSSEDAARETVVEELAAEVAEEIVLETDVFRAIFTNRGAQLISFISKQHANGSGGGVDMVKRRLDHPYLFALVDGNGGWDPLNHALFAVVESARTENSVRFEYVGSEGSATKEFWVRPDGLLGVDVSVSGRTDWMLLIGPGIRNPETEELEDRFARRAVVYLKAGEVEREAAQKAEDTKRISGDQLAWVGLEDNYFLASWVVTDSPLAFALARPVSGRMLGEGDERAFELLRTASEEDDVLREFELLVAPGADRLEGSAFFGAKQYNLLAKLPNRLNEAVNLGFFAILAKPILFGLRWLHDQVTSNWGWAIILMTVFIRILLFPLTHKSFVSMQKMQEVNPKVQGIRNKFRGKLKDKQGRPNTEMQRKMNEEVMALYKREGVNPAGGCLPMLLQIPVLFAFYNLLSAAVELRHAPWVLWIHDLSAPDPYYALPIIMGASQFLQQKLTPTAADPMQRRMFMLMPFFFTILFLGFPSGMVLYWLTNNVLGIAQQAGYQRFKQRRNADKAEAAPKRRSK
ncbi:MAG: membrane protein insertase YidC [Thermoanaerobaculia bacterium]